MAKFVSRHLGDLRCESVDVNTGAKVVTDTPKDLRGLGELMSPTDLLAAALGNCILSILAIVIPREGFSMDDVRIEVEKEMANSQPSRIGKLAANVIMPAGIDAKTRKKLENYAKRCPVHHSLWEGMENAITFSYPD